MSGWLALMWRSARQTVRAYGDPLGWWVTGTLSALAALIRLPNLGWPHTFSFDETYYAKAAFSLLEHGYERAFVGHANALLLSGNTAVFRDAPEFVVHPTLGKWMIALGEAAFGMNPFGWRIVVAVLGIAAVALLHRTALRLTSNVHVAALAALFMAIDGEAIALSRTALLDQSLMFFVLATFWALVRDRDYYTHTLAMRAYVDRVPRWRSVRPWRLAAIVFITAAFSTKWSALWFALAFACLAMWWDARARRAHEVRHVPWIGDLGWLLAASVIGVAGYLLSWLGWFRSDDGWGRTWTDGTDSWIPQPLRALMYYHRQALHFHVTLTSDHPYKASPLGWLLQIRPTSFFYESYEPGEGPCPADAARCASEVLPLGNVIVWWFAAATMLVLLATLVAGPLLRRMGRGSLAARVPWEGVAGSLVGIAAGWLPWLYFHERTTFTFYSIVFTPFMCLLAAQGLALLATRRVPALRSREGVASQATDLDSTSRERSPIPSMIDVLHPRRFLMAAGIVTLAVGFAVFAMPIWVGTVIPYSAWRFRMLFESWV